MQNSRESLSNVGTAAATFAAGAALMYLLDPQRGAGRRSSARDHVAGSMNNLSESLGKTYRDSRNRLRGTAHELKKAASSEAPSDRQLEGRVRSTLGRAVSHPRAIKTEVQNGTVVLSGPVLAAEVGTVISSVSGVKGVKEVVNRLEPHADAGDIPALQGGARKSGSRYDFMQENWAPSTRMFGTVTGGAMIAWGLSRRDLLGTFAGLGGLSLLLRSALNSPLSKSAGLKAGARAIDVRKTITIGAPVDSVFNFFSDYGNFPKFMRHVKHVAYTDRPDISHWQVRGPGNVDVEWDAEVTRYIPQKLLAWKTVGKPWVENAGTIHFQEVDGQTKVDIHLSYNPPGGIPGHIIASLLGSDPKSEMDDDLLRVKTALEGGNPPHDAAASS